MNRSLIAYITTLAVFALLDFVWLGFIARDFYKSRIGGLMLAEPNWTAAVLFYLTFMAGIVVFAVLPALDARSWKHAALFGALFGFFCYATYDLTNLATLKGWSVTIVVADVVWGIVISGTAATASFFATRAILRR